MQADVGANAKQLIVEKVRQATNIMVTVGANPSIDSLAAALALSLMLNKLDKHATAVFSGEVPSVMSFLEPNKTFESSVDSLRDFIISLDKEKADRLRYKVEQDVVRIFITPYKTTLSEKDLQFSQGDFNVEMIICLGVEKRDDLDKAIIAHGRILHDATVITINANSQQSSLGALDWHDQNASSLCEMLFSMSESFQKPGLIDAQIANALLTGIVAATERFSNQHTTPKVMTMAAQMMAAGANQQLVANNLQMPVTQAEAQVPAPAESKPDEETVGKDGELSIKHPEKPKKTEEEKPVKEDEPKTEPEKDDVAKAEADLAAALPALSKPAPTLEQVQEDLKKEAEQVAKEEDKPEPEPKPSEDSSHKFMTEEPGASRAESDGLDSAGWRGRRLEPPTLGGTLNATTEEAHDEAEKADELDRNKQILSHNDEPQEPNGLAEPATPVGGDVSKPTEPSLGMPPLEETPIPPIPTPPIEEPKPQPAPEQSNKELDDALQAVNSAYETQPFNPANQPRTDVGAQPLAPEPAPEAPAQPAPQPQQLDENGLPPIPPMPQLPVAEPGASAPQMPPMPPELPPLPNDQPGGGPPAPNLPPPPPAPGPNDPGQFKIPGQ